ncbi:MAG: MauE/DoxX family redox-associated membrane protein [Dehalococcoidia bacterium]
MPWVILGLRLVLAGMFAFAAAMKLGGLSEFRRAVRDFGVPDRVAPLAAVLVPLAEIAVAAALLPAGSAAWAAGGAAVLLTAFTVAVAINLALGRRPGCSCFGEASAGPIGPRTMARNLALIAVAAAVLAAGDRTATLSAVAWLPHAGIAGVASLAALFAAVSVLVCVLVWRTSLASLVGALSIRDVRGANALAPMGRPAPGGPARSYTPRPGPAGGLPIGSPAPPFTLGTLDGRTESLGALLGAGRPLLLAFVDPMCARCGDLAPWFAKWQREAGSSYTLALISRLSAAENRAKWADRGLPPVLIQDGREIMDAYLVTGTPSMIAVLADGTIGSAAVHWNPDIEALVSRFTGAAGEAAAGAPNW